MSGAGCVLTVCCVLWPGRLRGAAVRVARLPTGPVRIGRPWIADPRGRVPADLDNVGRCTTGVRGSTPSMCAPDPVAYACILAVQLISTSCPGRASRGVTRMVVATWGVSAPKAALRTGPAAANALSMSSAWTTHPPRPEAAAIRSTDQSEVSRSRRATSTRCSVSHRTGGMPVSSPKRRMKVCRDMAAWRANW